MRATTETRIYMHTCCKVLSLLSPEEEAEQVRRNAQIREERNGEACEACGIARYPKYRGTSAWAKHQLWCGVSRAQEVTG